MNKEELEKYEAMTRELFLVQMFLNQRGLMGEFSEYSNEIIANIPQGYSKKEDSHERT